MINTNGDIYMNTNLDTRLYKTKVEHINDPLDCFRFNDCEDGRTIDVAMFEDGSGIVIKDVGADSEGAIVLNEVVIDYDDLNKLRAYIDLAQSLCAERRIKSGIANGGME